MSLPYDFRYGRPAIGDFPHALWRRLLARRARRLSYAPYSRFRVGAALLAYDGRVFGGSNVENASSASALCAEQSALARAVSEGARRFRALLVLTAAARPTPPCGRCRQVLAEFAPDLPILLVTTGGRSERTDLAEKYRAGRIGYGDAKKLLLAKIEEYFQAARSKRKELAANPDHVEEVLRQGAERARAEARKTMELVRVAVGMKGRPAS